jgi:hypothetical protein
MDLDEIPQKADQGQDAARRKAGKAGSGKRLLELGHDGLTGFTSQSFKMHEWIR